MIVLSPLNVVFPFFSTTIASLKELLLDPLPITNNLSVGSNELVLVGVYVELYEPIAVSANEMAFVPIPDAKVDGAVALVRYPNADALFPLASVPFPEAKEAVADAVVDKPIAVE